MKLLTNIALALTITGAGVVAAPVAAQAVTIDRCTAWNRYCQTVPTTQPTSTLCWAGNRWCRFTVPVWRKATFQRPVPLAAR